MAEELKYRIVVETNEREATRSVGNITQSLKSMQIAGVGIATALTTMGLAVKKFISDAAKFESAKVRLNALFGSVEAGTAAFEAFNRVAATTPFTLNEVVEAGTTLKAFGVDAVENIKIVSDLAAFMGTSVPDAASAMGRAFAAGAGAADVFRERGVLNLIKMSQGIDDFKNISLEGFRSAMLNTFTDPNVGIAGATTKLAETFQGKLSNMQDAITRVSVSLGKTLLPAAKRAVEGFTALIESFGDTRKVAIETFKSFLEIQDTMETVEDLEQALDQISKLSDEIIKKTGLQKGFIDLENMQLTIQALENFSILTKEQRNELSKINATAEDYLKLVNFINTLMDFWNQKIKEYRDNLGASDDIIGEMAQKVEGISNDWVSVAKTQKDLVFEQGQAMIQATQDAFDTMTSELEQNTATWMDFYATDEQRFNLSLQKKAKAFKKAGISELDVARWVTKQKIEFNKKIAEEEREERFQIASYAAGTFKTLGEVFQLDAEHKKALAIIESIINTAVAVSRVIHNPFLAAAVAAAGAAQTALIAKQKIPESPDQKEVERPKFARGGIVGVVGEVPEAIIPLSEIGNVLRRTEEIQNIGGTTNNSASLIFNFNGDISGSADVQAIAENTVEALRDYARSTGATSTDEFVRSIIDNRGGMVVNV